MRLYSSNIHLSPNARRRGASPELAHVHAHMCHPIRSGSQAGENGGVTGGPTLKQTRCAVQSRISLSSFDYYRRSKVSSGDGSANGIPKTTHTVDVVQTWKYGGAHNLGISTMTGLIFY